MRAEQQECLTQTRSVEAVVKAAVSKEREDCAQLLETHAALLLQGITSSGESRSKEWNRIALVHANMMADMLLFSAAQIRCRGE